jgi:hypothetical protein
MSIDSFKTYVSKIDTDTDVYSYIGFVNTVSTVSTGYSNERPSTVLVGYDVDADGNISNFKAWTPND